MCRAFLTEPLDPALVDDLVDLARRAPAAGNVAALQFLVLDSAATVARYWDTTLPPERRPGFPWPGLLDAPVLVIPCVSAAAYLARYGEPDKAQRRAEADPAVRAGLAEDPAAWAVPYWWVDAGMAVENLLLGAQAKGLGALFFGIFAHTDAVRTAFAIPAGWWPVGTVALGRPAPLDRPSASAGRARPPLDAVRHRGRWPG
jgi:nitroreductase